jgi:hypothetical protein
MFYFRFIFLTMVNSIEQKTMIFVTYFRNRRFINGELFLVKRQQPKLKM